MSITVTAVKARQNLGELLNLVSIKHEEVIIERAGKKIARLTAIDHSTVNEPVAEEYSVQKKPVKKEPIDFSSIFGIRDDEEYRKVTEAVNSLRVIDPELQSSALEAELILKQKQWVAMSEEAAKTAIEKFRSIRGVGKEMWEAAGLTPDEYVRREREEWDESEQLRVDKARERIRTSRESGKGSEE
jgi:antitoxin (DNA-binding transcriptional repressor) of toxin-antitoxin stability system